MFIFILGWAEQMKRSKNIYIPLCLYLYGFVNFLEVFKKEFTFHYVYIYMFSSLANITQGTIFTFHYVYIYITLQFLRCQGEIHLHSTMFIFLLFALNSAINSGMIYIPLCLYLYSSTKAKRSDWFYIYIPLCLYLYPSLIISCIFTACNTIYCLPVKSKQLFTFLILVFSLYSSIFIEYSTFVVLPVF